jgi:two-component system, OmpR family, sensor histidine kinase VicK
VNINNFEQKIQKAKTKFRSLEQRANSTSSWNKELKTTTLTELSIALEELQVSAEELHIQNEELLATRMEIEQERQRYQDLFEFAPDGYLITDERGSIQEANTTALRMLKMQQKYIVNKPLTVFVAEANRYFFLEQLDRLKRLKQLQEWEITLQPREDSSFPAAIAVSIIQQGGKAIGYRWLIRDITERKQAAETAKQLEKEQELSKFKSRMLQTISSELCTPLNIISLSIQLLNAYNNQLEFIKTQSLFQKISTALSNLFHISDKSLFFSRLESGKENWQPVTLELEQYCHYLIAQFQSKATDERVIEFTNHAHHSTISIDRQFLDHIFENLLINALKYSFKKSVIHLELSVCDDNTIVFCIRDSGIGIPEEDRPYIFEPFYRAKNAERLPGVGLGLAIVKKAVDLCGGTISFESEVNVGSCFSVTLPRKREKRDI